MVDIMKSLNTTGTIMKYPETLEFVPDHLDHYKLFPNAIRLRKCAIEHFIGAFLYLMLFLINIKLKKYVT